VAAFVWQFQLGGVKSPVTALWHEFSALPFTVLQVSLLPVHLAKQTAINNRTTTVMTQASALVTQLVLALS